MPNPPEENRRRRFLLEYPGTVPTGVMPPNALSGAVRTTGPGGEYRGTATQGLPGIAAAIRFPAARDG